MSAQISPPLLQLMLIFLSIGVLVSLWLNLRLINTIKYLRVEQNNVEQLTTGSAITDFAGHQLSDHSPINTHQFNDYAKVFLFLSSKCNKCKGKLPELDALSQYTLDAGVYLQILTHEPKRAVNGFLQGTSLASITLLIDEQTSNSLNPQGASPYYLFVSQDNVIQAQGFIGDENWLAFSDQISQSNGAVAA